MRRFLGTLGLFDGFVPSQRDLAMVQNESFTKRNHQSCVMFCESIG